MTSVGYGDRFPRGIVARLMGILWILVGAVLVAVYTSVVTANITKKTVSTEVKLYGTKVGAIHNSSEYRLAVRKNGKLDEERSYNNLYDVYDALSKRRVQGALVDAYVLGSRRDLFNDLGVRINKIYDYSSAYGVVLAGEGRKLQKCFREYAKENRKEIFKIIEENVNTIKEDEESQSVKRAKSLIDPSFIVYKKVLLVTLILLFVAVMLGVLFEFTRKPLQRWLNLSSQTSDEVKLKNRLRTVQKLKQEWLQEMQGWQKELTRKLGNLRCKHRKQLKQWMKLKKSLERRSSEDIFIFSSSFVRYDEAHMSPLLQLRKLMENNNSETSLRNHKRGSRLETIV